MAEFNKGPGPTNDPSFLGLSKPISQPQADQTFETALKGIGNTFDMAIKGADFLVKESLEKTVYDNVDKAQEQELAYLNNIHSQLTDKSRKGNVAGKMPMELMSYGPTEEELPADLQDLPGTLESLKNARSHGLNRTAYEGRLYSLAKELRTQYPGYRPYIDKLFSAASGGSQANDLIRARMRDIRQITTASNSLRNKTLTMIGKEISEGTPGASAIYDGIEAGTIDPSKGREWVNSVNKSKWTAAEIGHRMTRENYSKHELTKDWDQYAANKVITAIDTVQIQVGDKQAKTIGEFRKGILASQSGIGEQISSDDALKGSQAIMAQREVMRNDLYNDAVKYGVLKRFGPEEVNKRINSALQPVDEIAALYGKKDIDQASYWAARTKAQGDMHRYHLLNHPNKNVRDVFRNADTINKIGGSQFLSDYFRHIYPKFASESWNFLVNDERLNQMSGGPDFRLRTFKDVLKNAKEEGLPPRAIRELTVETMEIAVDPKTPTEQARAIFKNAFDPANRDMLRELAPDGTDDRGKHIPGRVFVFKRFVNDAVANRILSMKDPELWNNYVNWAESEGGQHIFKQEMVDLRDSGNIPGTVVRWDPTNKRLKVDIAKDGEVTNTAYPSNNIWNAGGDSRIKRLNASVNRLNDFFSAMSSLSKATGEEVEDYLAKLIKDSGYETSLAAGRSVSAALPEKIFSAIITAKTKEMLDKGKYQLLWGTAVDPKKPAGKK